MGIECFFVIVEDIFVVLQALLWANEYVKLGPVETCWQVA